MKVKNTNMTNRNKGIKRHQLHISSHREWRGREVGEAPPKTSCPHPHSDPASAFGACLLLMILPVAKYLRVTASLTSGEIGILKADEPTMSSLIVNSSVSKSSADILVKPVYISESD